MNKTFEMFASDETVEESGDVMPQKGQYGPMDTGLYKMAIKLAYLGEAASGARNVTLVLQDVDAKGPEVKQVLWLTSGKAKGQRHTYTDRNGVPHKLPDMEQADNLHEILNDVPFSKAAGEEKVIKLYNFDTKQEENTSVMMVMSLVGKPILVGLHKVRDNKMVKKGSKYVPTSKERFTNQINKFFEADTGLTNTEKRAKTTDPVWLKKWKESFGSDYVNDKYVEVTDEIEDDFKKAGTSDTKSLFP